MVHAWFVHFCHFQHVPPAQSWAHWAALLDGRCGHCPARSLRGWIQTRFCTASSHGWTRLGQSCAFGSVSSHLHWSPYHRTPRDVYQNVSKCRRHQLTSLHATEMCPEKTGFLWDWSYTYTQLRCAQKVIFRQFVLAGDLVVLGVEGWAVIYGFWK